MQNMVSVNRSQRGLDAFGVAVGDNSISDTLCRGVLDLPLMVGV